MRGLSEKSESRKKNLMKKIVVLSMLCIGFLGINQSQANILFSDNFNSYSSGNLVGQGGWAAHSAAGLIPVQVSGGAISLVQGSGSREDVNHDLGATMGAGDTWYYAFNVSVSGFSNIVYFASFLQGTANYEGRLFVGPSTGSDFTFGLSGTSSSMVSSWGTPLTYGTPYRVVVSYAFDTQAVSLWVNPVNQASTSISDTGSFQDAVTAISFRQASASNTEVIDNLVVATTFQEALTGVSVPEPSTLALGLLGGLAGLVALRRKR
jgi:PEP-CTERM motif